MAIHQQGNALVCVASFLASGGGATGLAVSVDVYELGLPSGTPATIVTAASATEIARGLYYYRLAGVNVDANALYVFAFYTLGTADQKVVVQGWTAGVGWVENVNASVSTRATQTSVDAIGALVTAVKATTDQIVFSVAGKVDAAIVDAASFAQAAADKAWNATTRTLTAGVDLSAAAIAAVWDALTATLTTAGSIGKYLVDQLAVVGGDPLMNTVPGDYPSGSAGAALGRIGSGIVQYVSPLSEDGTRMDVKRGDDYLAEDARAFTWTDGENMWMDPLASATFTARIGGVITLTKPCIVSVATGAGKQVQLELTAEETAALELGMPAYRFDVELVDDDGHKDSAQIHGRVYVAEDQTHA